MSTATQWFVIVESLVSTDQHTLAVVGGWLMHAELLSPVCCSVRRHDASQHAPAQPFALKRCRFPSFSLNAHRPSLVMTPSPSRYHIPSGRQFMGVWSPPRRQKQAAGGDELWEHKGQRYWCIGDTADNHLPHDRDRKSPVTSTPTEPAEAKGALFVASAARLPGMKQGVGPSEPAWGRPARKTPWRGREWGL